MAAQLMSKPKYFTTYGTFRAFPLRLTSHLLFGAADFVGPQSLGLVGGGQGGAVVLVQVRCPAVHEHRVIHGQVALPLVSGEMETVGQSKVSSWTISYRYTVVNYAPRQEFSHLVLCYVRKV